MSAILDKIRLVVLRRRNAYKSLFMPNGSMTTASEHVLGDLRKFCRATSTPAVVSFVTRQVDPIATGIAIGRLEVWHRIAQNLNLSDADIYRLMSRQEDEGTE